MPIVHLLTYAAPVTQKMLQFNDLDYYTIPRLPEGWVAPMWLKVQIGIFAGRLYFPFHELEHIRKFLGLEDFQSIPPPSAAAKSSAEALSHSSASLEDKPKNVEHEKSDLEEAMRVKKNIVAAQIRSTKMLTFLHAWLGTRGKGQDFTHTPMGYVCARKLLTEDHPFFRGLDTEEEARSKASRPAIGVTPEHPSVGADGEEDDESNGDEDEWDERQKLTEEELRRAREGADDEDEFVEAKEFMEEDVQAKADGDE